MPRTVVYDSAVTQAHMADVMAEESRAKPTRAIRRKAAERAASGGDPTASKEAIAAAPNADGYLSKIAKYVPAESVSLTLAAFAAFKPDGNTVWVYVGAGALANVVYLWGVAANAPVAERPRWYFYLLSIAAFFGWSVAVIEFVQTEIGIEGEDADEQTAFVLTATAFIVPALDNGLRALLQRLGW